MKMKKLAALGAVMLACTVLFTGCSFIPKDLPLVHITYGDNKKDTISLGYANFAARYNQAMYDETYRSYYGDTLWSQDATGNGTTLEQYVKKDVLSSLEERFAISIHAKDYKVSLTAKEKKAIRKAAKKFMKNNSDKALKQIGATEEYVERYLTDETLAYKVRAKVEAKADDTVTEDEAAQKAVTYVLFSTADSTDSSGNTVKLSDEEIAALKQQATTLSTAADFDAEVKTLGATASSANFGDADIKEAEKDSTTSTTLPLKVMKKANTLAVKGVTAPVYVKGKGYYVVRMDSTFDESATQTKMTSMASEKRQDYYNTTLKKWEKKITWKVNKTMWSWVDFKDLFEQKGASSTTSQSSTTGTSESTSTTGSTSSAAE